ncbi:MAG: DUF5640 domain-containing protein [Acutalibacteraceae bacterium]
MKNNFKRLAAIACVLCLVVTMFAACSASPQKKLVGTWKDSTGITGYTFNDNNVCKVFLATSKLGVDGSYTVDKRDDGNYYITIKYSVPIAGDITTQYMFSVEGDTLTLTTLDESPIQTTLIRQSDTAQTAADTNNQTAASSAS